MNQPDFNLIKFSPLHACLTALIFLILPAVSLNARADNYFFYDGIPLFHLSDTGQTEKFSLLLLDPATQQFQLNQNLYKKIPYLWSYQKPGKPVRHEVSKLDFDASPDACVPKENIILKNGLADGLFSSMPPPARSNETLLQVTDERREIAQQLLEAALVKRRVSATWRARLMEMVSVREVQMRSDDRKTLLVQLHDDWKKKSISALLLLTESKNQHLSTTYLEINIGGISGSEPEAARINFMDYISQGQSGTQFILLRRDGYESADWLLLKQSPKDKLWHEAAKRETGC